MQPPVTFAPPPDSHTQIPVAIVGIVAFKEASNLQNLMSIMLGLAAGCLFVVAKARGN